MDKQTKILVIGGIVAGVGVIAGIAWYLNKKQSAAATKSGDENTDNLQVPVQSNIVLALKSQKFKDYLYGKLTEDELKSLKGWLLNPVVIKGAKGNETSKLSGALFQMQQQGTLKTDTQNVIMQDIQMIEQGYAFSGEFFK